MKKSLIIWTICVLVVSVLSIFFINKPFYNLEKFEPDDTYEITSYVSKILVKPDNSIEVEEELTAVFYDNNKHGIYRALPNINYVSYAKDGRVVNKNYKVKYSDISASSLVDYFSEDGYVYLKLGDEYNYLKPNTPYYYNIKYTMTLGDDRESDFDFFYFNIVGDAWDTSVSNVSFNIIFEKPIETNKMQVYIANQEEKLIDIEQDGTKAKYYYEGTLNPGEALTVRTELEQGYFAVNSISQTALSFDIVMLVMVLFIMMIVFILKKSNSVKKDLVTVVEFKKPDGFNSAEVGYVIDGHLSDKDIVSLIVYWANQGYISIKEENRSIYLTKLKPMEKTSKTYKAYEKRFFDAIFAESEVDVLIDDLGKKCIDSIMVAIHTIKKQQDKKVFNAKAKRARTISAVLASIASFVVSVFVDTFISLKNGTLFSIAFAILIFFAFYALTKIEDEKFIHNAENRKKYYLWWGVVAVILIVFYELACFDLYVDMLGAKLFVAVLFFLSALCIKNTNIRTEKGVDILGRLVGLREYIEKAEKDQLEFLVQDNPNIFYEILPYAYVLGVSDVWIKKFEDINIPKAVWYSSDIDDVLYSNTHFSIAMFRSLSSASNRIGVERHAKTISTNSGSSSGGFGGGFSGGGFGGGGGGSW